MTQYSKLRQGDLVRVDYRNNLHVVGIVMSRYAGMDGVEQLTIMPEYESDNGKITEGGSFLYLDESMGRKVTRVFYETNKILN